MPAVKNLDARAREQLESYIAETMRQNHLYGLSISLVADGKVVFSKGFGSRSVDPPFPATQDTLYGIGSSTKFFTAVAILKLVESGKLSLNDPVEKFIKDFKYDSKGHPVTIHQLLSHTSGYPDLGMANSVIGHMLGQQSNWTPFGKVEDLIAHINGAHSERVTTDGDVFMYWNEGYILLGKIIEETSGMKYTEFVEKNILLPLGMKRTTFERSKLESDGDGMTGYYMEKDGSRGPRKFPSHPLIDSAGGLLSSSLEMSRFVSMLINGGSLDGVRILKKETLEKAYVPYVKSTFPPSLGEGEHYGYGITVDKNFLGHIKLGHGGNVAVASAYFGFVPDLKIGVALASNSDFLTSPIGDYALALMMGKDPNKVLPWVIFQKKVEAISGKYETYKGGTRMTVALKGFTLTADIGEGVEVMSSPIIIEGNEYFIVQGPDRVRIDVKIVAPGKVDIRIDRMVFHRVGNL